MGIRPRRGYNVAIVAGPIGGPIEMRTATSTFFFALTAVLAGCGQGSYSMTEHKGLVTFKGNALTLLGDQVAVGQQAPAFTVLANDLSPLTLADFKGKVLLISAVPSLDTPVCDLETRRFNEEAAKLGPDVAVLTVSMDLPFAQKRWCAAHGIAAVKTASDHREASFGLAYGVLIKELRLLSRTIFVIDKAGKIAYVQLVAEVTHEPDYADVLQAVAKLTGK